VYGICVWPHSMDLVSIFYDGVCVWHNFMGLVSRFYGGVTSVFYILLL